MAKAEKPETTKKQAVIDYLTAHPAAAPAEVVKALHKQGVEVSGKRISALKWAMTKEKAQKPTAKKAPEKRAAGAPKPAQIVADRPPASEPAPVNKTQAVKDYLAQHRKDAPKDVAAALRAQGLDVSSAYVSGIKLQMNKKQGGRKKVEPASEVERVLAKDAVSVGLLQRAKKLAAQLGGIKEAKAAIDALAQILH